MAQTANIPMTLVGMDAEEAKTQLEELNPDFKIFVIGKNDMVTMDYRTDRIRIMKDDNGKVIAPPQVG